MADENYKLAKFQSAVFAEIDMKTAQIKQEAELLKEQELEKNKDIQLEKSYNHIQKRSNEIMKKYKRDVAKFSMDRKRDVLLKRGEITERVFNTVREQLGAFTETDEYKPFLCDAVKRAVASEACSSAKLLLREVDMPMAAELKQLFSCPCEVCDSRDVKIGGFILVDQAQGVYLDETLEQRLIEQKDYFMQHSQLNVALQ